jgi:hypothetical protein
MEDFMPIPDIQSIMLPIMKIVSDKEEHTSKDILNELILTFDLSDDEKNQLLQGGKQTVFQNMVAWAKAHLNMAGLLVSPRKGCIRITESGLSLLEKKPAKIDFETLKQIANGTIIQTNGTNSTPPLPPKPNLPDLAVREFNSEPELQYLVERQAEELFPGYKILGVQYQIKTEKGIKRIDILLKNELENKLLAIELKKGVARHGVSGQIDMYLNLLDVQFPEMEIEGVIIAGKIDGSLKIATRNKKNVKLKSCKIRSIDLVDE